MTDTKILVEKARWLRKKILEMTVKAGAGHIAPSFSCTEILVSIYYSGLFNYDPDNTSNPDRDRFILSKGQAAVALYAVLADKGFFPIEDLDKFTQPGSCLGGHAEDNIPGIEAFTGSLGMGLGIATGIALSAKLDNKNFNTIALLGDGECHEGSVWESAMFAAHHELDNLMVIIDNNGQSATAHLEDYLDVDPLDDKWRSFGWEVVSCDGHNFDSILPHIKDYYSSRYSKPLAVIAKTVKGKGVSFMEKTPLWHYRIPVGDELNQALKELDE